MPNTPLKPTFDPRWDAQVLADAAEISADPARLTAAQAAAQELKEAAEARASHLDKISRKVYDHPSSIRDREQRKQMKPV